MAEYNKWVARGELIMATGRSAMRGVGLATAQHGISSPGVNVIRYHNGPLGLEGIGRIVVQGLEDAAVDHATYRVTLDGQPLPGDLTTERRLFSGTLSLLNSGHTPTAAVQFPRLFSPTRRRWGMWHWELTTPTPALRVGLPFVDEVWTTSSFQQDAFRALTRKPVRVIPLSIVPPAPKHAGRLRASLGIGDAFLFGHQSDLASSGERKNASAVVKAYTRAFPVASKEQHLLVKVVHGAGTAEWSRVHEAAGGRGDVSLSDEYWPSDLISDFFDDIDCYVSLHRSEGFGLTMAHAMAAAKPVIATAYSGNLDFMTADTSGLVDFRLVRVGPNPVYPSDGRWAEPDLDSAAEWMQAYVGDRALAVETGRRARQHVVDTRSRRRCADWLRSAMTSSHSGDEGHTGSSS